MHILLIDDNPEIIFGLEKLLHEAHFTTKSASSIESANQLLNQQDFDLIILDWMLPDGSGVEFLAQKRGDFLTTPLLLLSSKSEIEEKVEALDAGADDYLAKPFSNIELMARVRALLRRESSCKSSLIELENLNVNLSTREIWVEQKPIELTNKEFQLLELLLLNQNVVLTRYQINEHLNPNCDSFKTNNLVDSHIKNLRKKLGLASGTIETVRGVGFRIKRV